MELNDRKKLIGKRIKEMREKAGLNQTQLASELSNGVKTDRGKSTISEYEHGKNLNLDNIHRIAEVLNTHIAFDENYLLGCQEHPDITTSWIAEQIPLNRDAINRLEKLKGNSEIINSFQFTVGLINQLILAIIPEDITENGFSITTDNPGSALFLYMNMLKKAYEEKEHQNMSVVEIYEKFYESSRVEYTNAIRDMQFTELAIESYTMKITNALFQLVENYLKSTI